MPILDRLRRYMTIRGKERESLSEGSVSPVTVLGSLAQSSDQSSDNILPTDGIETRDTLPDNAGIYIYSPLPENASRLIHLHSGTWSDPISFDLRPFSLEPGRLPFYEAVSYHRGSPDSKSSVRCCGFQIVVWPNVESLLRRFRLHNTTRLLWVDTVCINQLDDDEKSSQVIIMDRIYRHASRVLVYLGEIGKKDTTANVAMHYVAKSEVSSEEERRKVLLLFHERPWFTRVWVLQEVALAECALVICGPICVAWACFTTWWARNSHLIKDPSEHPPTLSFNAIDIRRSSLLQQLHDTRRSHSTDPRDKVYALMGLLLPQEKGLIRPNYNNSTEEVYREVAAAIIKNQGSLKILSVAMGHGSASGPRDAMCSWVPDWRMTVSMESLGLNNMQREPFDAGGVPACGLRIEGAGDTLLSCLGITLDTIQETGDQLPTSEHGLRIVPTVNKWGKMAVPAGLKGSQEQVPREIYKTWLEFSGSRDAFQLWEHDNVSSTIQAQPSSTLDLPPKKSDLGRTIITRDELRFSLGRRFIVTTTGFIGLAPPQTEPGDTVAVLLGAPVPHILRKSPNGHFRLVGECYIHGVMGGEALGHLKIEGHRCRPCVKSKSDAHLERFVIE